ncbi:MAG TPA: hypothetical protein VGI04_11660 [Neobacillus sp.]
MWEKLLQFTLVFKTMAGLFFSAGIIIYMVLGYMLGEREISFSMIVQIFFLSIVVTGFQYLFWEEGAKSKLSSITKILLQYVIFGILLFAMSQWFAWFTLEWGMIARMFALYTVIFLGAVFGFFMYFRILGMQFNRKMLHYRAKKNHTPQ